MDLPATSFAARLFAGVTDPRVERTRRHLLCDILLIALCATLAGAEGFCDIAAWGETKEGWLHTFLELPGGIPSHDPFERVFRRWNPKELHACFLRWIESLVDGGKHVAIDAKPLCSACPFYRGKSSVRLRLKRAGWDDTCLSRLLSI